MSTLRGMFDPKPRSKRNFLLENIKGVGKDTQRKQCQTKSQKTNQMNRQAKTSQTKAKAYSTQRHKFQDPVEKSPSNQSCVSTHLCKQNSCLSTGHSESFPQTPSEIHSSYEQRSSGNIKDCIGEEIDLPDYKLSYIDEENIPFRWTQVCPSIISHTVCHQAVQTVGEDDLHTLLEDGCIKYPSFHTGGSKERMLSILEWPTYSQDEDIVRQECDKKDISKGFGPQQRQTKRNDTNVPEKPFRSALKPTRRAPTFREQGVGPCIPEIDEDQSPLYVSAEALQRKGMLEGTLKADGVGTEVTTVSQGKEVSRSCERPSILKSPMSKIEDSTQYSSFDQTRRFKNQDVGLHDHLETFQQKGVLARNVPEELQSLSNQDQTSLLNEVQKPFSAQGRDNVSKLSDKFRVLSEQDRRKKLEEDSRVYDRLVAELNKMPVRTDTLRTKRRKMEIEKELDQLERRIRALSRISD